jgi:hypothetical protein
MIDNDDEAQARQDAVTVRWGLWMDEARRTGSVRIPYTIDGFDAVLRYVYRSQRFTLGDDGGTIAYIGWTVDDAITFVTTSGRVRALSLTAVADEARARRQGR